MELRANLFLHQQSQLQLVIWNCILSLFIVGCASNFCYQTFSFFWFYFSMVVIWIKPIIFFFWCHLLWCIMVLALYFFSFWCLFWVNQKIVIIIFWAYDTMKGKYCLKSIIYLVKMFITFKNLNLLRFESFLKQDPFSSTVG